MDARTRKKLLGKARTLMHLLEGHYGALPADADYGDILREGLYAAMALAMPVVVRQARRVKPSAPVEPLRVGWGDPLGDHILEKMIDEDQRAGLVPRREEHGEVVLWRNVPAWKCQDEPLGIGRGLPAGDVL